MKNKWVRLESDKVSVTRIAESLIDDEKTQLSAYVESDVNQVKYLIEHCPNTKIIHFKQFLTSLFYANKYHY